MGWLYFLWIFGGSLYRVVVYGTEDSLYMDDYGTCQNPVFFEFQHNGYVIHAKGTRQSFAFATKRCSLRFKTNAEKRVCVEFKEFHVEDCSVHFKIFQEKQPINLWREPNDVYFFKGYSCGDSPWTVCSAGSNLTLQLYKGNIDAQEYNFQVKVLSKSKHTDTRVTVAVIIGVVLAVVIPVIITLYYCCYKKHRYKCSQFQRAPTEGNLTSEDIQLPQLISTE